MSSFFQTNLLKANMLREAVFEAKLSQRNCLWSETFEVKHILSETKRNFWSKIVSEVKLSKTFEAKQSETKQNFC